ncbi:MULTISPECIES: nucleotidyltransferase substrate binding protein [unclassified Pasteurella]
MQDILKYQGEVELWGSKAETRLAFNRGLIQNGEVWLEMVESRN